MAQWQDSMEYSHLSDVGMRRRNNQDSFGLVLAPDEAAWHARGHVLMVADGMGAHAAGELASKIAVDTVPHLYMKLRDLPPGEALERAIHEANAEVHRRGMANPEFHQMGTTSSILAILPDAAWIAHIGDSRVYRLRNGSLEQLTFDHSLVWEAKRDNSWPAGVDPSIALPKNVITRSLGPNAQIKVDVEGPFPVAPGDTFLLCSDGLTGLVPDEELAPILAHLPADDAAALLVDLANLRGGTDNITVLVARILPPWAQRAGAPPSNTRDGEKRELHPAAWVGAGVCGLAALGLLVARQPVFAAVAAVVGGLVGGIGWLLRGGLPRSSPQRENGQGQQAPYTHTPCTNARDFVRKLAQMFGDLRSAARDSSMEVVPYEKLSQQAETAAKQGQEGQALRAYAQGISSLMQEFRTKRRKWGSDSVIDI